MGTQETTLQSNYFTVKKFSELGFISESGLRHLIFKSKKNGFDKVIKKIGKKILISYSDFEIWLNETNKKNI